MARKPRSVELRAGAKFQPTAVAPPAMPPLTEDEQAMKRYISQQLNELAAQALQRNLDNAVLLAQQAARGQGDLVSWFSEIGRRFGHTLGEPQKPKLRLVKGKA